MKVSEILSEGKLKGSYTVDMVRSYSTRELNTLRKNAETAKDQDVIDLIDTVEKARAKAKSDTKRKVKDFTSNKDPVSALSTRDLEKISIKVTSSVGQAYPDSDPTELLIPFLKRNYGIEDFDIGLVLDRAVKQLGEFKSYNDYLANVWDQFSSDNPGSFTGKNPWQ